MIWPGKRAERRGVGEVLGLCLHWGSWGDPHFQKKTFSIDPFFCENHWAKSSLQHLQSIPVHSFIISTTLSFLLPEVIFRWAAFTTFGAFWKCQGEYNNPPRKGSPSSMGPWPNSTSLNQLGFRWPSGGDQSGRINSESILLPTNEFRKKVSNQPTNTNKTVSNTGSHTSSLTMVPDMSAKKCPTRGPQRPFRFLDDEDEDEQQDVYMYICIFVVHFPFPIQCVKFPDFVF